MTRPAKKPGRCSECGGPLTGRQRTACSDACRYQRETRLRQERLARIERTCQACGVTFTPRWRTDAVACSQACQGRWARMTAVQRQERKSLEAVRKCSAAPGGKACPHPVTREAPICRDHLDAMQFSTWRDPPRRYAHALAWSGYSAQGAAVALGET